MKTRVQSFYNELSSNQVKQFDIYFSILVQWNEMMNLTAITEKDEVYEKHFLDSIELKEVVELDNKMLLDVGSGAGFPSIPLKIMIPSLQITIIDALQKRVTFLKTLCQELGIKATIIHGRVEEFDKREEFDIVTARAVANLTMLSELCIPFVKKNGYFVAYKGPNFDQELNHASDAIHILGGTVETPHIYTIDDKEHALLPIKKTKKTPNKYPRRFSQIKKNPLTR